MKQKLLTISMSFLSCLGMAEDFNVQVGPRPYFLISQMKPSPLKSTLESCADKKISLDKIVLSNETTTFSIVQVAHA